jgi:hypothetical protein
LALQRTIALLNVLNTLLDALTLDNRRDTVLRGGVAGKTQSAHAAPLIAIAVLSAEMKASTRQLNVGEWCRHDTVSALGNTT